MDEHTAFLIRSSIAKLTPMAERVDVLFNERLLDIYPDVFRLFALDISPEERKLTQTISIVLVHLGYFGAILPTVKALARSHKVFRLVEMYYDALGETLIWTLRRSLGAGFSSEVERAWNSALSRNSRARLRVVASRD
ncbi:MAG: hypothetical protein J0H31_03315 [Alphaproteobacteria bacterium]|nr:hypothetical protein [Alphaproteobacteria bacterium]